MPDTPVPSAATEASLETRVATAIWGYVDEYGIGRAHEVITLVRSEVAREIMAVANVQISAAPRACYFKAAWIARGESR